MDVDVTVLGLVGGAPGVARERERESHLLNPPPGSTDPERFAAVSIGIGDMGPIAPRHRQIRNYPRAPSSRRSGLVGPHTTPAIVNYKYMTSTL